MNEGERGIRESNHYENVYIVQNKEPVINEIPDQCDEADGVVVRDVLFEISVRLENTVQNDQYSGDYDQRKEIIDH